MTNTPITFVQPCPPHQWAHSPTVGSFDCWKCKERINYDDPRYAEMLKNGWGGGQVVGAQEPDDAEKRLAELRHWFFQKLNPEQRMGFLFAVGVAPRTCDFTLGMQHEAIRIIATRLQAKAPAPLNMCAHGADRGSYCGYCGGVSQGRAPETDYSGIDDGV